MKRVDAAEVRFAAVHAAAADAVLVAEHLPKLRALWLPHGLLMK
jgi:hypothetical protein